MPRTSLPLPSDLDPLFPVLHILFFFWFTHTLNPPAAEATLKFKSPLTATLQIWKGIFFLPRPDPWVLVCLKFDVKMTSFRILKSWLHSLLAFRLLLRSLMTFFKFLILCIWSYFSSLKTIRVFSSVLVFWNFTLVRLMDGALFLPLFHLLCWGIGGAFQSEDLRPFRSGMCLLCVRSFMHFPTLFLSFGTFY